MPNTNTNVTINSTSNTALAAAKVIKWLNAIEKRNNIQEFSENFGYKNVLFYAGTPDTDKLEYVSKYDAPWAEIIKCDATDVDGIIKFVGDLIDTDDGETDKAVFIDVDVFHEPKLVLYFREIMLKGYKLTYFTLNQNK